MKRVIQITGLFSFLGFIFGLINVSQGNFSGIAWPFILLGIFIWGDGLIIGPLIVLACIWLYLKNSKVLTGLFFSTFAAVRSFIEIIYSLNAQFSQTSRPWELGWREFEIVKNIEVTEIFVLSQLIFTCIFVVSFLSLLHFIKRYLITSKNDLK